MEFSAKWLVMHSIFVYAEAKLHKTGYILGTPHPAKSHLIFQVHMRNGNKTFMKPIRENLIFYRGIICSELSSSKSRFSIETYPDSVCAK